ncbi:SUKH-3 domain-containing protein [Streptomyces sp. NPDC058470]|uniref:SUKH-3 domain-containing protein n=1 Tax=Streptomyces sp. NPDC058470 TaxID=3346515 RepID=UPI00365875A8
MIRFDSMCPALLRALGDAGWHSKRRVSVGTWLDSLHREGYFPNLQAQEILAALGGLVIQPINRSGPNFSNDEPFTCDPISAGSGQRSLALEIEGALGGKYFPIGEWLSWSSVFMGTGGEVVAAGLGWIWGMGSTFEDALELAVCADRPLVCLYSPPGLHPWPR